MNKHPIRSMIRAAPGNILISCDLSQAETWVVAYLAREENMKYSLLFSDIHTDTASALFFFNKMTDCGVRHVWGKIENSKDRKCKVCEVIITEIMRFLGKKNNHANSYGQGPEMCAQSVNQESDQPPYATVTVAETTAQQKLWHSLYTGIKPWWNSIQYELETNTRTLTTPYRRQRTFYGHWGDQLFKEAYAYIPQSTVADHFNGQIQPECGAIGGLIEIYRRIIRPSAGRIKLCNQSHDSCIIECPRTSYTDIAGHAVSLLKRPIIINDEQVNIPVDCEVGEIWGEMERLKIAA
jgi:hypothetical protein